MSRMIVGRSSPLAQLLVVGLLLLPTGSVLATHISVNGTVKMEDGSPVAGVQVIVLDPRDKTFGKSKSKGNGKFKMIFLPAPGTGPYRFKAVKDGLLMSSIAVNLLRDARDTGIRDSSGSGMKFNDEIGAMQEVPEFEISPTGMAEVHFVMVPDSHFAAYLTVPGDRKATELLIRANKLSGREMYEQSNELLLQLVDDGIEVAGIYYLLGRNFAALGNDDELVRWFEKGLTLHPDQPGVHGQLASAASKRGDKELALEHYDKELEISPDSKAAAINRALVLEKLDRTAEAVEALERVVQDHPDETAILAQLASLYMELDQDDKAAEILESMQQADDPDPTLWFNIGAGLSNRGDYDKAMEAYEKALKLNPELAEAVREIGFLQIRAGDKDAAVQYLEQYLELRPDAPDAASVQGVKDTLVKQLQGP